jgi:hypothetical protein
MLAPAEVPLHRTRGEVFDDLVLDAVEDLERNWAAEIGEVEFAVQEVPEAAAAEDERDTISDRGVPLAQLFREGVDGSGRPMIVVFRRPVEARAARIDERADLVFTIVAELVAELLGRDIDEIDPPGD